MTPAGLRSKLLELPQYFVVSCVALAADTGVLLLLNTGLHLPYLLAATLSFIAGGVVGYRLSIRFVWARQQDASKSYEIALFILLGVVGLAINAIIMLAVVGGLGAPLLLGKAVAAGCTFFCNFFMRRRWVFPGATRRIMSWLPQRVSEGASE